MLLALTIGLYMYTLEKRSGRHRTLVRFRDRFGWMENSEANSFSHTPHLFPLPSQTYKQLTQKFPRYLGTSQMLLCLPFLVSTLLTFLSCQDRLCQLPFAEGRGREVMPSKVPSVVIHTVLKEGAIPSLEPSSNRNSLERNSLE